MNPSDKPPLLPSLSIPLLMTVEDIEQYAAKALQACGDHVKFNNAKAVRILRACAIDQFNKQVEYYTALANYDPSWIEQIKNSTIASAVGLLPVWGDVNQIQAELYRTIQDRIEQEPIKAVAKPKTSKSRLPSNNKSFGKQLQVLADESRLPIEDLAEAVGLTPRSVYRHLSGETSPRKRHIAAYEKLFSKNLNREVRLPNVS